MMTKNMYKNLGVDWNNIPTIEDLEKDRREALNSYNNQKAKIEHWLELLDPKPLKTNKAEGRTDIQPRLIRKQVEWRVPSLEEPFLATKDMYTISSNTHIDVASAKQNELIINKQFRTDIDKVDFINKLIRTAVSTGTAILKVGWIKEEAIVRQQVEKPILLEDPEQIQQFLQLQIQKGQIDEQSAQQILMSGQPIPSSTTVIENIKKTIKDSPTIEVLDPRNLYIDPACNGNFSKVKYIIDKFSTDISSLKKDGRFVNLDKIDIENSNTFDEDSLIENKDDSYANYSDRARKKIDVFEYWGYWDIQGNDTLELVRIFYTKDVIIRAERNPYPDKQMPYIIIPYLPVLNSLYGESDAVLLEDNQKIIGMITRGMIDILGKSAVGQRAYKKDALDFINEARMKEGKDFAVNPHINNPNDAFHIFSYADIPPSAFNMIQYQNNEAEALTGIKAFSQGISGQALGDTATAVRSALDATTKRDLSILRRISKGLESLAQKIVAMNGAFLPDEIIVQITDDEEVVIKRDDLAYTYDFSIEVSTPESDNQKASELAYMLQTLGNNVDFSFTQLILADIADLRKMPELAYKIRQYQPQPDPLAQRKAELEIQLLEAQIANEYAKADENKVDVQLKQAKTAKELATTRAANSNADMVDLDYLEKATGLQQERKLEEIKLKEDLKPKKPIDNKK